MLLSKFRHRREAILRRLMRLAGEPDKSFQIAVGLKIVEELDTYERAIQQHAIEWFTSSSGDTSR